MSTLLVGWIVMLIAAATPGPSTLAIMGTSLAHGRRAGIVFASGVICGSCFWGLLAAFGLGALLATVGWALVALKICGALYLLWLAWKSAIAALRPVQKPVAIAPAGFWRRGVALHLTNPKAVLGWTATIAVGLPANAGISTIALFLVGCALLATVINFGYALVFSTSPMVAAYRRSRKWIEGALAGLFAAAGIGLLLSRS